VSLVGRCAAALVIAMISFNADARTRKWVVVPGHRHVFVDLGSIKPMPRMMSRQGIPSPEDTSVDIKLNGRRAFAWLTCFPIPTMTVSTEDSEFSIDGRVIGYVPTRAVMAIVCPRATPPSPSN
jgi:hypothetical protein